MIITLLLKLLIVIFTFIASFIGGLLPSLPGPIKDVLDIFFSGMMNAVSFVLVIFDINVLIALISFWLIIWSLEHLIQFIIFIFFNRAKVE